MKIRRTYTAVWTHRKFSIHEFRLLKKKKKSIFTPIIFPFKLLNCAADLNEIYLVRRDGGVAVLIRHSEQKTIVLLRYFLIF